LKALLAGLVIAGSLIVATPASATTTATCIDRVAPRICAAQTLETHVKTAVVQMGRYSRGTYTLTCTKGSSTAVVSRGFVRLGDRVLVNIAGPGRVDCKLRSVARATQRWAFVRVILVN
jgi:hypothetical protein